MSNYGETDDANLVLTLPDIDTYAGIRFKVHAATDMTTNDWCIKAAADNKFYLGGTAGADNGCICLDNGNFDVGDELNCYTATNGASVTDIFCVATVGAWTAVADNTGSCPD